jgi:hypothetical protein
MRIMAHRRLAIGEKAYTHLAGKVAPLQDAELLQYKTRRSISDPDHKRQ